MADDSSRHEAPTRRDYMKYGGAVVGGGLLAGCAGQSGPESTPTETGSDGTATHTSTPENEGYSVTMSPVGTIEFDEVPEKAAVWSRRNVDLLVALGQQDRIGAMAFEGFYHGYYDELPGVEFDTDDLPLLWQDGLDKEIFYELESDIHHLDPTWVQSWSSLDEADFEEIRSNIAPFFDNYYSRAYSYPGDGEYEFYTLWEQLEKYAQVYQAEERAERLSSVHDELVAGIQSELPPQEERPDVGLVIYDPAEEAFTIYRLNSMGWGKAHTRPCQANDGLDMYNGGAESNFDAENVDMEGMLEADPDVLLQNGGWIDPSRKRNEEFLSLEEHPVGRELSAVKSDRLYLTGSQIQGPISNLFQIEIAAKQIYPELFGQPPAPGESVPEGEQLFDRQRVADIINGEV